ncbi:MAG TPA: chemotaxis protein CheW [Polyangiaceae bacterium]
MGGEVELQAEVDALRARLTALEARLHKRHKHGRPPGAEVEVLFLAVGKLLAAFELEAVSEVVPAAQLAPLPEAPSWVLGTLNLRGSTIPVVDIASRLSSRAPGLGLSDIIVIVATELGTAGVVVSEVGAIRSVRLDQQASFLEAPHAAYVVGSFSHDGQARLLLGVPELLRHSELAPILERSGA